MKMQASIAVVVPWIQTIPNLYFDERALIDALTVQAGDHF